MSALPHVVILVTREEPQRAYNVLVDGHPLAGVAKVTVTDSVNDLSRVTITLVVGRVERRHDAEQSIPESASDIVETMFGPES